MYKLIKTKDPNNEFDKTNVTVNIPFNDITLDDLSEAFTDFVRACGFFINNRRAAFIPEEEAEALEEKRIAELDALIKGEKKDEHPVGNTEA